MNTKPLERFAQQARRDLLAQTAARLDFVLTTDSAEHRARAADIERLQLEIRRHGRAAVIDRAAYTWFNRFCALRFMDANGYTSPRLVSPAPGHTQPELLAEAKAGHVAADLPVPLGAARVFDLLSGGVPSRDGQGEAYRLLLVAACNRFHKEMPFLFEPIADWTELLLPEDLLSPASVLADTRATLTEEVCRDVEVIGWLYQFYISEKKADVDAKVKKGGKVEVDELAAKTSLYTPHWIVRYLVENSLGRLWLLNRPHSRLAEQMPYYVPPDSSPATRHSPPATRDLPPATPDFWQITSPEELRVCDPACGSGHLLTYAFDLLYAIYEEEGYNPPDIPRLILSKNLTGLEIDERAGDLAAFALMMKGRARDRRFFTRGVAPDVVVLRPPGVDREQLAAAGWFRELGRTLIGRPLQEALLTDLHALDQAANVGSLIRPQLSAAQIDELRGRVDAADNLLTHALNQQVLAALDQLAALARPYTVVVANPPYMGGGSFNDALKKYVTDHYADSKADLFAVFIERCLSLVGAGGLVGMITMQSWMFLSSFEKLRAKLLAEDTILSMAHLAARAFDTIGGEVVSTTAFVLERAHRPEHRGEYLRLVDGRSEAAKSSMALEAIRNPACGWFYRASAADFRKIPGAPIAYWVSPTFIRAFELKKLRNIADAKQGMATSDNNRFLRYWHEVGANNIAFNNHSLEETETRDEKWYPYNKGGSFRRWYGNNEYVVNWQYNGKELRAFVEEVNKLRPGGRLKNQEYYFRENITYSALSTGLFSARFNPSGFLFDTKGSCIFADLSQLKILLSFLNSNLAQAFLDVLCPTLDYSSIGINGLPVLHFDSEANPADPQLKVQIAKEDWDSYETSWDFTILPLLRPEHRRATLAETYAALRAQWRAMTLEMQSLEERNNRLFIDAYGLQDELTADVPLREVTLTCNPAYRYGEEEITNYELRITNEEAERDAPLATRHAPPATPDAPLATRHSPPTPSPAEARLLADTLREFVSYGVGCLFGRYSLDKPGLILADAGGTVEDYARKITNDELRMTNEEAEHDAPLATRHRPPATRHAPPAAPDAPSELVSRISYLESRISNLVSPDADGVLPIVDGDWFADDIVGQFRGFLRATFGEAAFRENVAFLEQALGRDLRAYFLRDFYDHHLKTYKKRPIYWLFSSPRGSFNALIYLHRYRPDTPAVVLNDYLRPYRAKLAARRNELQRVAGNKSAAPRERTLAQRDGERLESVLAELAAYERDTLEPLAARRVALDLDDGVKVNYNKLGPALRRVPGLSE